MTPSPTKVCRKCGEEKLLTFFGRDRTQKSGYSSRCRACTKESQRRRRDDPELRALELTRSRAYRAKHRDEINARQRVRKAAQLATDPQYRERNRANMRLVRFGLSEPDYYRLLEDQGFCCASCGDELELRVGRGRGKSAAHVDHCHETGHVRAVLCGQCNTAFGHLQDDLVRVERLAVYARRHSQAGTL